MMLVESDGRAAEVSRRVRLTADQVHRSRSLQMFQMRLSGRPTREIAAYFSFSPQYVNRLIRAIPGWQKERIVRASLAG